MCKDGKYANEYCENNNVRGEYEGIYDYEMKYPKYPGSYDFNRYTDSYFEKIMGDVDSFNECAELKRKFFEIKQKYFRNSSVYNNGVYTFILKSKDVNCDTGMISIKYYQNDGNGEVIGSGSNDGVKVDNLVSLLTNHKLFENKLKVAKKTTDDALKTAKSDIEYYNIEKGLSIIYVKNLLEPNELKLLETAIENNNNKIYLLY